MAVINGTITGGTIIANRFNAVGAERMTWLIFCSFAAYTASADTNTITGINTFVQNRLRDGRTATLRSAVPALAGRDTAGTAVYSTGTSVQAMAISGGGATGQLSNAAGTEIDATASTGVGVIVTLDLA
jgi:hypothetical protein